jgi:hypothetical protein
MRGLRSAPLRGLELLRLCHDTAVLEIRYVAGGVARYGVGGASVMAGMVYSEAHGPFGSSR